MDRPRLFLRSEPGAWIVLEGPERRPFTPSGQTGWQVVDIPGDGRWSVETSISDFELELEVRPFTPVTFDSPARTPAFELHVDTHARAHAFLSAASPRSEVLDSLDPSSRAALAREAGLWLEYLGRPDEAALAHELSGFYLSRQGLTADLVSGTFAPRMPALRWLEGQWAQHKRRASVALAYLGRPEVAYQDARRALDLARLIGNRRMEVLSALRLTSAALQAGLPLEPGLVGKTMDVLDGGQLSNCTEALARQTLGWLRWLTDLEALGAAGSQLAELPAASTMLDPKEALQCPSRVSVTEAYINLALAAGLERRPKLLAEAERGLRGPDRERARPWLALARALAAPSPKRLSALAVLNPGDPVVDWYRWQAVATFTRRADPERALEALRRARDLAEQPDGEDINRDRAWMAWRVGESLVRTLFELGRTTEAYAAARRHQRHHHARTLRRWGDPTRAQEVLAGPLAPLRPGEKRLLVGSFRDLYLAFLEGDGVRARPIPKASLSSAHQAFRERLEGVPKLRVVWTQEAARGGLKSLTAPYAAIPDLGWTLDLPPAVDAPASGVGLVTVVDVDALGPSAKPGARRLAKRGRPIRFHPRLMWGDAGGVLFLGHGGLDTGSLEASLRYAEDTARPSDIYQAPKVAPSVGIFACSKAAGADEGEAPRDELPQALILAGAGEVVAARGLVREEDALELADRWIDALEKRSRPAWTAVRAESKAVADNFELWTP